MQRSDSELCDISLKVENNLELDNQVNIESDPEIVQENIVDMTLEQCVKNYAVAATIFAGTFVLPCFIAAKLLK